MPSDTNQSEIRVKFVGKLPTTKPVPRLMRFFPGGEPVWGRCRYTFHHDDNDYDWLVAYDEIPPGTTRLACPKQHTILVTAEPSSIKVYGSKYLSQFGHVLTGQEPFAIDHPGVIRHHPALLWYFGKSLEDLRTYEKVQQAPPVPKDKVISTVCSNKAMGHTLHRTRYEFTKALEQAMPQLDRFGRGVHEIKDKSEALDRYKYHVAIENHCAPHHITEKLTDAYLGATLPFYFGAPNVTDYFPRESYIPIDIRNTEQAIEQIKQAIANDEYEKRLSAIMEARRITLEEQSLFAVVSREIERLDTGRRGPEGAKLINRRSLRTRNPIGALCYLRERYAVQARLRRESN